MSGCFVVEYDDPRQGLFVPFLIIADYEERVMLIYLLFFFHFVSFLFSSLFGHSFLSVFSFFDSNSAELNRPSNDTLETKSKNPKNVVDSEKTTNYKKSIEIFYSYSWSYPPSS